MYNITLVSTRHSELGECNSNALYKIIENINPDVIFDELSSNGYEAVLKGLWPDTLETRAVRQYLQKKPVPHYPVDLDGNSLINKSFKNDITEMFELFEQHHQYNNLLMHRSIQSERLGFSYLNSSQYLQLSNNLHFLENEILKMFNHEKLHQTYKLWLSVNDMRENAMIKNIYNYSNQHIYNNAIFICGAEHRKSIIPKIQECQTKDELKLNWSFYED